jgi:hypothetical protein
MPTFLSSNHYDVLAEASQSTLALRTPNESIGKGWPGCLRTPKSRPPTRSIGQGDTGNRQQSDSREGLYGRQGPHDRIFANPRSCLGFRFERTDALLYSMVKCNSHIPA